MQWEFLVEYVVSSYYDLFNDEFVQDKNDTKLKLIHFYLLIWNLFCVVQLICISELCSYFKLLNLCLEYPPSNPEKLICEKSKESELVQNMFLKIIPYLVPLCVYYSYLGFIPLLFKIELSTYVRYLRVS